MINDDKLICWLL